MFSFLYFYSHSSKLLSDTQGKDKQESDIFGNRKQSKIILQPKKSLETLRLTIGSNGRPVTN